MPPSIPPRTANGPIPLASPADPDDASLEAALRRASAIAATAAMNASDIDRDGAFPSREFAEIANAHLLAAPLSRDLGGLGLGSEPGFALGLLRLLAILGWGNLSVARLYEGHANALLLMQTFGSPEQIARLAADARDHGSLFAVWNTEAGDGVRMLPAGDGWFELEGAKTFASGAGHVSRPLLTGALPGGGWQMAVLAMEQLQPRIDESWWRPLGMRASASYKIDLTGIRVGPDDLIGEPGDYYRQPWFSGGAIRFAAAQLGGAAALLDAATSELKKLDRTTDLLQHARMGQAAIGVRSGELWLREAARLADDSSLGGALSGNVSEARMVTFANMMRSAIERICLDVLEIVERSVGARGLLQPHPIERIGRDLTLYLRQPAPDAALTNVGQFALASHLPILELWPDTVDQQAFDVAP